MKLMFSEIFWIEERQQSKAPSIKICENGSNARSYTSRMFMVDWLMFLSVIRNTFKKIYTPINIYHSSNTDFTTL